MPYAVKPKVFLIAGPRINYEQVDLWLQHIDSAAFTLPNKQSDASELTMLAGKRCYMAFVPGVNQNVTKVRDDMNDYITNILASGHGSVLGHSHFTFALEGISRVCTAELNRHRIGANISDDEPDISEGSMRYIRFGDIPWTIPTCIHSSLEDDKETMLLKQKTRMIFDKAFSQDQENYAALEELWADKLKKESPFKDKKNVTSMMRRVVGIGCATGGTWTYSLRALRNIFEQRCDSAAEEEILDIATQMLTLMKEHAAPLFDDFQPDANGHFKPKYHKV